MTKFPRSLAAWMRYRIQIMLPRFRGLRSQYGQDRWILYSIFPNLENGYFLDIGASDGDNGSNTYALERRGWNGLCVEPNPDFFASLQARRQCACDNACLSDCEKDVWFSRSKGIYGGISTIARPEYSPVHTVTVSTVLHRHRVPPVIHYCSIDTEGSELEILSAFPFESYTVLAFTIEHNHNNNQRTAIRALLEKQGYRYVRSLGVDDCYLHARMPL